MKGVITQKAGELRVTLSRHSFLWLVGARDTKSFINFKLLLVFVGVLFVVGTRFSNFLT